MLQRVDFVMLPVQDMARSVAFYRDALGLTMISEDPASDWVEFELGELVLGLGRVAAFGMDFVPVTAGAVAFGVADLEAARKALEAQGVPFLGDNIDSPVCRMACFADPDGNVLMVHRRHDHQD